MNLQDTTIEDEVIEIRDAKTFNAIGKGAVLKNCEVQIAVPSRALSICGAIVGGTISTKRELQGFDWLGARLDGGKFKGRFKNNRFGNFPPMYDGAGAIANCDFSEARLQDALFLNTECEGVKFGAWPHATIANTSEFHSSIERCKKKDDTWEFFQFLSDYIHEYGDDSVTLNFMTIHVEDVCKREGLDIEALRSFTNSIHGIVR